VRGSLEMLDPKIAIISSHLRYVSTMGKICQKAKCQPALVLVLCLVVFITSAKEDRRCLFVCLCVCVLATLRKNFRTDLHEIFRDGRK